jgi:hypothetical protein
MPEGLTVLHWEEREEEQYSNLLNENEKSE